MLIPVLTILLLATFHPQSVVVTSTTIEGLPGASTNVGRIQIITDGVSTSDCTVGGGSNTVFCRSNGSVWAALTLPGGGGAGVPTGLIALSCDGPCPSGWSQVTGMNGRMPLGTLQANGDVGSTGGSDAITPAGSISQPVFTGDLITDVLNHTHSINITDPGHSHVQGVNSTASGGLSGYTADTSTNNRVNSGYSTSSSTTGITAGMENPSGGVASITPSGTVSQPIFTGTQMDNRSAYLRCVFCRKD